MILGVIFHDRPPVSKDVEVREGNAPPGGVVDLLTDKLPDKCPGCGRILDLTAARPILDRYADIMRAMADADFEIELEIPEEEEEEAGA